MDEYEVDAPVGEIVRWIKEDVRRKAPRLLVRGSKDYRLESDFDREEYGIGEDEDARVVSVHGVLGIQSRTGRKDWTLQFKVDDVLGLHSSGEEDAYEDEDEMGFSAFDEQFLSRGLGEVEVTVAAETREAKARFDRWLSRRMASYRP